MGRRRLDSHLYRRPDSPVWWCWFYDDAERLVRKSTRCTDKGAAKAVLAELELRARSPTHRAAHETTLQCVLADLVDERRDVRGRAAGTIDMYERKSQHLNRLLGADAPVGSVVASRVDWYVTKRLEEGAARTSISKELTTLRAALKLAKRRGAYPRDIAEVMPAFSAEYVPRKRFLTEAEAWRLLAELEADRAARVAFIIATGCRWGESERARREDVTDRTVALRGTKTKLSARTVPVLPAKMGAAKRLLGHAVLHGAGAGPLLFAPWPNVRRDLAAACERAGIARVSPNDLRRTLGTWLRARGVAPGLIGSYLGHADGRMVERVYGRLPAEELLAAITGDRREARVSKRAPGQRPERGQRTVPKPKKPYRTRRSAVPGPGIEPGTRGFSIRADNVVSIEQRRRSRGAA
jgi:integrase